MQLIVVIMESSKLPFGGAQNVSDWPIESQMWNLSQREKNHFRHKRVIRKNKQISQALPS